jgi:hypothetical protein
MNNNFEEFLNAYIEAPQNIKGVIDSDVINTFIDEVLLNSKYLELKSEIIQITSRKILNLRTDEEVLKSLLEIGIDAASAQVFFTKISDFSKTVVDQKIISNNTPDIVEEIAETEAALNSINPIRTMATDSGQPLPTTDTIYSSMQSAILREGKGQQTNSPRWDSEN